MGFFSKFFERRSYSPNPLSRNPVDLFGGGLTAAGIDVTPETALKCPPVKACVKVLSEDVGKTPIRLRRAIGPDAYVDAREHPLFELLHALPNPETDAFTFVRQMTADAILFGRSYAQIIRSNGRVEQLWRLDPLQVRTDREPGTNRKRWTVTSGNGTLTTFVFDPSMPPILELVMDSPLHHARDVIGTYMALQQYTGRFFKHNARPSGILTTPDTLDEGAAKALKQAWLTAFGGSAKAHQVAVLEGGLTYQSVAANNADAQMNELLGTLRNEICGVFRVPPYKVSDLSRASYANTQSLSIEYAGGTLDPIFRAWELSLRRDVLTARQYQQYTFEFDRSALIQSDVKSLYDALATARQAGIFSVNDCRRKLGENPVENGDELLVNSALVPVAKGESNVAA